MLNTGNGGEGEHRGERGKKSTVLVLPPFNATTAAAAVATLARATIVLV